MFSFMLLAFFHFKFIYFFFMNIVALELIIVLPLFSTVVPSNICMFLSRRPFLVNTTFSTVLVGVEVNSVS